MIRYTDPTVELTVKGIDLTGADIWATFRQGAHAETFVPENVAYDAEEGTSMEVSMTQLDSAGFSVGTADVQVNWVLDGKRNATRVKPISIGTQLLERELP